MRRMRRRRWRWSRATCRAATVPATSPSSTARCRTAHDHVAQRSRRRSTGFPDFFLAHELAHQWWGQAVGWKNYHEQWISEGFAQYFAALYAQKTRGDETFVDMLRQFRRWSLTESDQGPVHLGYRLGPHQGATAASSARSSTTRAPAVLHMLRRLLGDEVVLQRGCAASTTSRSSRRRAPTICARAFEAESGRSLERFFERWIYNTELPLLRYRHHGRRARGRRPLRAADGRRVFDVPVTVTRDLRRRADAGRVSCRSPDKQVEHRFRAEAPVRQVQVNRDSGGPGRVRRKLSDFQRASRTSPTQPDGLASQPAECSARRPRAARQIGRSCRSGCGRRADIDRPGDSRSAPLSKRLEHEPERCSHAVARVTRWPSRHAFDEGSVTSARVRLRDDVGHRLADVTVLAVSQDQHRDARRRAGGMAAGAATKRSRDLTRDDGRHGAVPCGPARIGECIRARPPRQSRRQPRPTRRSRRAGTGLLPSLPPHALRVSERPDRTGRRTRRTVGSTGG